MTTKPNTSLHPILHNLNPTLTCENNKNLIFNSFFTFMLEIPADQYVSIMPESYLS